MSGKKFPRIEIVRGDIVRQNLEAVVNAANGNLIHGAGVAGAIKRAGGNIVDVESEEWVRKHGPVSVGSVAVTNAGNIPGAKKVIHAVGPLFSSDARDLSDRDLHLLRETIRNALEAADTLKLKSIAIPAISCGVFGGNRFIETISSNLLASALDYLKTHEKTTLTIVRFVLFDEDSRRTFTNAYKQLMRSPQIQTREPSTNNSPSARPMQSKEEVWELHDEAGTVYVGPDVQPEDVKHFRAAGILLYRLVKGEIRVLLGTEYRQSEGIVLNPPGGQKDSRETPEETAAREFWEETGKVYKKLKYFKQMLKSRGVQKIWFGPGKYVIFVVKCPGEIDDIDVRYNTERGYRDHTAEMESLLWARWETLVAAAREVSVQPEYTVRSWRHLSVYRLSKFLIRLLQDDVVVSAFYESNILQSIVSAITSEVSNECSKATENAGKVLDQSNDWQMKVQLPSMAPVEQPPIITLKPSDSAYISLLNLLPDASKARVLSIRKVQVLQCKVEHAEEEKRLGDAITQVIDPTFHGTPETWRATNIAFKGFDVSLKLHGRACGDGVYASTDIKIPLGYSNNSGSILQLRGLLTQNDYNQNNIQVFRNEKQVLPQYIIDFATVTGEASNGPSVAEQKHNMENMEREKLLQLQRDAIDIKEKEKAFKEEYNQRYLDAHSYYVTFLNNLKTELQILSESGRASNEIERRILSLSRRLEIERNQFCSLSPIYMDKRILIQEIKQNDVVIVSAATGSGKSTQLPQYILDDVFETTETRRVAVLEPRRFNAISLCNRVSRERAENMGMEVGYSLGQGDLCVSTATRIEFMTHGLFINRALKPENIVGTYGAVVLDEAHERSVDVDLCFALLRRALIFASVEGRSFKV